MSRLCDECQVQAQTGSRIVLTSRSEGRSEGMRGSAAALMHYDVMCSRQDAVVEASVTSPHNVGIFTGYGIK